MGEEAQGGIGSALSSVLRSLFRILCFLLSFGLALYAFSLFFVDTTAGHDGPVVAVLALLFLALPIGCFAVYGFPRVGLTTRAWKDIRDRLCVAGAVFAAMGGYSLTVWQPASADRYTPLGITVTGLLMLLAAWRVHVKHCGE